MPTKQPYWLNVEFSDGTESTYEDACRQDEHGSDHRYANRTAVMVAGREKCARLLPRYLHERHQ